MIWAVVMSALGAIDPGCTKELICTPGYTSTIRPAASYTNKLKASQMKEQSLPGNPSAYEEDHFIPLELCGHPTDPDNLWPQAWPDARKKDADETRLHRAVCHGRISLEDAQVEILGKWGQL